MTGVELGNKRRKSTAPAHSGRARELLNLSSREAAADPRPFSASGPPSFADLAVAGGCKSLFHQLYQSVSFSHCSVVGGAADAHLTCAGSPPSPRRDHQRHDPARSVRGRPPVRAAQGLHRMGHRHRGASGHHAGSSWSPFCARRVELTPMSHTTGPIPYDQGALLPRRPYRVERVSSAEPPGHHRSHGGEPRGLARRELSSAINPMSSAR